MHVGNTILAAAAEAGIDENWCLLDNQSTCNAFINKKYLSNIRDAPNVQYLCVHCNSGVTHTNNIGDLPGYSDPVWYNPKGIANILSLGLVQKNHPVTYNSQDGNEFVIHIPQRPTFKITKAGLFYHDMRHLLNNKDAHIMVNDLHSPIPQVQDKKKIYTAHNIRRAYSARQFQHITVQPMKRILHAVDNKILKNMPIMREDVRMAEDIYVPSIPHPKGKTVRHKIQHAELVKITIFPKTIIDKYKEVAICCDLIHINGIGFLNTISRNIMFSAGSLIKKRKIENISDGITQIHKLYLMHDFKITYMPADFEFEPLRNEMTALGINLNCAPQKEHVPEIKLFVRTVKDCVRSARVTMPFKQISKLNIVHFVAFPPSTPGAGLSDTKGPRQLVPVNTVDCKKFFRLQPGEYV